MASHIDILNYQAFSKVGSLYSTVAISIERYLAVAHPFAKLRYNTKVNAFQVR